MNRGIKVAAIITDVFGYNFNVWWKLFIKPIQYGILTEVCITDKTLSTGVTDGNPGIDEATRRREDFFLALDANNTITHLTVNTDRGLLDFNVRNNTLQNHPSITFLNLYVWKWPHAFESEDRRYREIIIGILTQNRTLTEFHFTIHDKRSVIEIAEALRRIAPNIKKIRLTLRRDDLSEEEVRQLEHRIKRALRENHSLVQFNFLTTCEPIVRRALEEGCTILENLVVVDGFNLVPINLCEEARREGQQEPEEKEQAELDIVFAQPALPHAQDQHDFEVAQRLQRQLDAEANAAAAQALVPMFAGQAAPAFAERQPAAAPREAQAKPYNEADIDLLLAEYERAEANNDTRTKLLIKSCSCNHVSLTIAADPVMLNGRLYDRCILDKLLNDGHGQGNDPMTRQAFTARDISPAWDIRDIMDELLADIRKKQHESRPPIHG